MSSLGHFHYFEYLPTEIRCAIWAHNIWEPRIVRIECEVRWHGETAWIIAQEPPRPLPAASTCRESRREYLHQAIEVPGLGGWRTANLCNDIFYFCASGRAGPILQPNNVPVAVEYLSRIMVNAPITDDGSYSMEQLDVILAALSPNVSDVIVLLREFLSSFDLHAGDLMLFDAADASHPLVWCPERAYLEFRDWVWRRVQRRISAAQLTFGRLARSEEEIRGPLINLRWLTGGS